MKESYKSKSRRKSFTQVCKKLSLNIGNRSRPLRMRGRRAWGRLQMVSRSRSRVLPNVSSPWVRDLIFLNGARSTRLNKSLRVQLQAKKHLKWVYGAVPDRQLKKTFRNSSFRKSGEEHLLTQLEHRLGSVVHRSGFTQSPLEARQWISNGWILVNGSITRSVSFCVEPGDIIQVNSCIWYSAYRRRVQRVLVGAYDRPAPWILVDYNTLSICFRGKANVQDMTFSHTMDMGMIDSRFSSAKQAGHRSIQ